MYKVVVYHKQRGWRDGNWDRVARSLIEKPGHLKRWLDDTYREAGKLLKYRPDNPIYTKIVVEEFLSTPFGVREWTNESEVEAKQLMLPGVE